MTSKYKLTDNTKFLDGKKLYQIQALKDFGDVKCGDLGGYIESKNNLSQFGNAWVYGNALVYGNAQVYGDARVYGSVQVYGNAEVCDDALVYGNARVCDDALVYGNARVCDDALVYGNARVCGNSRVYGNAEVYGDAQVFTCGPIGSRHGITTFYRTKDNTIWVACGCYCGSIDDFAAKVDKVHKGTKHQVTYQTAIALARAQIELDKEGER